MKQRISPEEIRQAADNVQRSGFGDFMFQAPRSKRRMSSSSSSPRRTSSSSSSSRRTSSSSSSSRRTSSSSSSSSSSCCRTTQQFNRKSQCWKDGNMWELRMYNE